MATQILSSKQDSKYRLSLRDLALVSGFAAILVGDGYVSSLARAVTRSTDVFFLIAALFTILALLTRKRGMSTLLSVVTGLIFLATPGAPFPPHITLSLVANGIAFDLALIAVLTRSSEVSLGPSRNQLLLAGSVGNMIMALVALIALQVTVGVTIPLVIWPAIIFGDAFVGTLGAFFGFLVTKRLHVSTTRFDRIRF